MNLEDSVEAKAWLFQFSGIDREVARQLLRKLILVSETDFEIDLQKAVESVLNLIGQENVALFSITEPPNPNDQDGTRRIQGSSADRVKHILENLVRLHGNRVRANPTVNSMRSDRIKNIVLVEDFIGSGNRVSGYWKTEVSKSVKSWISYGWTRVWVVSYGAIESGIANVRRKIPKLTESRIVTVLPFKNSKTKLSEPMEIVAQKYGEKLRGKMWLGYGDGGGTLIFQHGCPNNTPAILWAGNGRFKPLFPNRGIPVELQPYFGKRNYLNDAENLWGYSQYKLALTLIDRLTHDKAAIGEWSLTIALAFASKHGQWNDNEIQNWLQISNTQIDNLRLRAYKLNLIDKQSHIITPFGRELLEKLRKHKPIKNKSAKKVSILQDLYYPDSCEGISKH